MVGSDIDITEHKRAEIAEAKGGDGFDIGLTGSTGLGLGYGA